MQQSFFKYRGKPTCVISPYLNTSPLLVYPLFYLHNVEFGTGNSTAKVSNLPNKMRRCCIEIVTEKTCADQQLVNRTVPAFMALKKGNSHTVLGRQ